MAAIAVTSACVQYLEDGLHRCALLKVSGVSSLDTLDLAGAGFKKVQAVSCITASIGVPAVTIAGTVVTVTLKDMANESLRMLVVGQG